MPTVKEFMTKNVVTIEKHKTIVEAAQLMSQKRVGDLIIMDGEMPIGIVTERDFVRRIVAERKTLDTRVTDIMTTPLKVINPDASLRDAARKMVGRGIRRLPVIENDRLIGIITATDLARHLCGKTLTEEILEAIGHHYSVPEGFKE